MNLIRVFEWETIRVNSSYGDNRIEFTQSHFDSIVKWQDDQKDNNGHKNFFRVGNKSITFSQWVGVIQSKELTIEIIPKAEKTSNNTRSETINKWSKVLQQMLAEVQKLPLRETDRSNLNLRQQSLMDLYYSAFLSEVDFILHKGLVKKYRVEEKNRLVLKGKLNFNKQISHNLVHKERFYTSAQEFDTQNRYNEILVSALEFMSNNCTNNTLRSFAKRKLFEFPDWPKKHFISRDFDNFSFDRKTQPYHTAIRLARLILFQMNPQFQSGKENVMALFFDMNRLWEEWLLINFKKHAQKDPNLKVLGKKRKDFWISTNQNGKKILETDILIEYSNEKIVFDAKWKLPKDNKPSDNDLKQMFVYNMMYGAKKSALLYPAQNNEQTKISGNYNQNAFHIENETDLDTSVFSSDLHFIDFTTQDGKINNNWLEKILIQ